jgi:predicted TIM-barrel fold metal-dependent hydrolase
MATAAKHTRVIDGDGHIMEAMDDIQKRLPREYLIHQPGSPFTDVFPPKTHFHAAQPLKTIPGAFHKVGPQEWVEFCDEIGLEVAALYPTNALPFGFFLNGDWAIAACRAYNDWLHDTYLTYSQRFAGMGILPMQEPEAAAEELERLVKELGMAGGIVPATGLPEPLGTKRYWPVYKQADKLGCCIAVHGGNHARIGLDFMNVYPPVNALGHPFSQLIAFASIVFNGVFDHFPGARFGFLEAGAAWVEVALERFERAYQTHIPLDPRGQLLQIRDGESLTDYLRRHAAEGRWVVGCDGDEDAVASTTRKLGKSVAMFSTDFPHEVDAKRCRHEIDELVGRADLDDDSKENVLWRNAARFYHVRVASAV